MHIHLEDDICVQRHCDLYQVLGPLLSARSLWHGIHVSIQRSSFQRCCYFQLGEKLIGTVAGTTGNVHMDVGMVMTAYLLVLPPLLLVELRRMMAF